MGPSMSNPQSFKQKNKQKHVQAYQRKYPTQISISPKIKLKGISQFGHTKHQQSYDIKMQMKRQEKAQFQPNIQSIKKKQFESQSTQNETKKTLDMEVLAAQKPVMKKEENKKKKEKSNSKLENKIMKETESISQNKKWRQPSNKKIILNNQSYEVDMQKMKSRRLKNKQRYTNSIISNLKNCSQAQTFNIKPSVESISNFVPEICTLEIQSQVDPRIQSQLKQNSQNKPKNLPIGNSHSEKTQAQDSKNMLPILPRPIKPFLSNRNKSNSNLNEFSNGQNHQKLPEMNNHQIQQKQKKHFQIDSHIQGDKIDFLSTKDIKNLTVQDRNHKLQKYFHSEELVQSKKQLSYFDIQDKQLQKKIIISKSKTQKLNKNKSSKQLIPF